MANIYRIVVEVDHPHEPDVQDWFRTVFPDEFESVVRASTEAPGVKAQRWSLVRRGAPNRFDISFLQGPRSLLVVERQHPDSETDASLDSETSSFRDLLQRVGARIGPFVVGSAISVPIFNAWISDITGPDAIVATVVVENPNSSAKLLGQLDAGLVGLAATGAIDLKTAETFAAAADLRNGRIREGCIIYGGGQPEHLEIEVLPATVVSLQPQQATRRIRQHCLRRLAHFRFTDAEEIALVQLSLPTAGANDDAEEFLGRLLELEDEAVELRDERQLLILEQDELATEVHTLQAKNRWLERRLQQLNDYSVPPVEEEIQAPDSCTDAIRLARELLPNIWLGDVMKEVLKLDGYEKSIVWAKKIWTALLALDDYAAANADGRHIGNFLSYCSDPPAAAVLFNPQLVAMRESDRTESDPKTHALRVFKVPEIVDPDGKIYMGAHLKVDAKGSVAPRIHFYDDTARGRSGKIYVGYAGPHLPTGTD